MTQILSRNECPERISAMRCQMTIPALATLALVQFAMYARAADSDLLRAIKYGATAKLTVKIVDDAKQPVEGAKIEARFDAALSTSGESKSFVTDTNGMAVVSGKTGKSVSLRATKDGYYGSTDEVCFVSKCYIVDQMLYPSLYT